MKYLRLVNLLVRKESRTKAGLVLIYNSERKFAISCKCLTTTTLVKHIFLFAVLPKWFVHAEKNDIAIEKNEKTPCNRNWKITYKYFVPDTSVPVLPKI